MKDPNWENWLGMKLKDMTSQSKVNATVAMNSFSLRSFIALKGPKRKVNS